VGSEPVHSTPRCCAGHGRYGRQVAHGARPDLGVEALLPCILAEALPVHEERAHPGIDQAAYTIEVMIDDHELNRLDAVRGRRRHRRVAHATSDDPKGTAMQLETAISNRLTRPRVRFSNWPGRRSRPGDPLPIRRLTYTSGNRRNW
jgi:hypothetical protein